MGEAEIEFVGDTIVHKLSTRWKPGTSMMELVFDGRTYALRSLQLEEGFILRRLGVEARVKLYTQPRPRCLLAFRKGRSPTPPNSSVSPMPGLVVSVAVAVGQDVRGR